MILILGETGLIGNQLSVLAPKAKYRSLSRNEIIECSNQNIPKTMHTFFREKSGKLDQVFIATGVTNSQASFEVLRQINCVLPINILKLGELYGFEVITFGTIHEESSINNNYIRSKKLYRDYIEENTHLPYRHFQLHTLFGKYRLSKHSFLGQIADSILNEKIFRMSSGDQFREFHEVSHDVETLFELLNMGDLTPKLTAISNGQIVTLKDVAKHIFEQLDKSHLLKLGVKEAPANEIYDLQFFAKFEVNQLPNPNLMKSLESLVNPQGSL